MLNLKKAMAAYMALEKARESYNKALSTIARGGLADVPMAEKDAADLYSFFRNEAEPLTAAIEAAEGRARARTIDAEVVLSSLHSIEAKLAITKKALEGVIVYVDANAQSFPGAYNNVPYSTHFSAIYKRGAWHIEKIYRYPVNAPTKAVLVVHTEESKAAIIARHTNFAI